MTITEEQLDNLARALGKTLSALADTAPEIEPWKEATCETSASTPSPEPSSDHDDSRSGS